MITDLNKIIAEWSFRTKSGILDAKSMSHQIILEELLKEYGWPLEARSELVNNLMEAKPDLEREKLMKQKIKYKAKDKEGKLVDKEITVGGALKQGEEHPAYEKAKQLTSDDDNTKTKGQNIFTGDPNDAERDLGGDNNTNVVTKTNVKKQTQTVTPPSSLTDKFTAGRKTTSKEATIKNIEIQIKNINDGLDTFAKDSELSDYHKDYAKVKKYINRLSSGQKLNKKEKDFLSKYVRLVEPPEGTPRQSKIYVARVPGRFTRQGKKSSEPFFVSKKGHQSDNTGKWNEFLLKQGLMEIPTSTYGRKTTTANSTFRNEDGKVKLIGKSDSKDAPKSADGKITGTLPKKPVQSVIRKGGKVVGVKVGNQNVMVVDTSKLKGNRKKRAEISNRNIIMISKSIDNGTMDFIDMDDGVVPDSADNRVIVIQGAINGMTKKIRELNTKYGNIGKLRPDKDGNLSPGGKIIKDLEDFAKRNPNDSPEKWLKDFKSIMSRFANHNLKDSGTKQTDAPSLSESWANYAEIYDCIIDMQGNGKGTESGSCALLPESTTLETVDVISLTNRGEGEQKYVTLDGRSVKKGTGGASALTAKCEKTEFIAVGSLEPKKVKEKIVKISKMHDSIYSKSLDQNTSVHNKLYEDNKKAIDDEAKSVGISQNYIDELDESVKGPEKENRDKYGYQAGGGEIYQKVMSALYGGDYIKKGTLGGIFKKRKNEKLDTDPETLKKLELRLISYFRYGQLSHKAYNQNVDTQDFHNDSVQSQGKGYAKSGEIDIDASDGIDIIAYPQFEGNVGWTSDGRSSNPGAGRFKNKPKIK